MSDHINWAELLGGDRRPYDPRPDLDAWRRGEGATASKALWAGLIHKGDVDTAAYAAVVELVQIIENAALADWNAYALIASIEEARLAAHNPPLPVSWIGSYQAAWSIVAKTAPRHLASAEDDIAVRSIFGALAHAKGQHALGKFALLSEDEQQELLRL